MPTKTRASKAAKTAPKKSALPTKAVRVEKRPERVVPAAKSAHPPAKALKSSVSAKVNAAPSQTAVSKALANAPAAGKSVSARKTPGKSAVLSSKAQKDSKSPAPPSKGDLQDASPADLVDTQLAKYRSMRDFKLTAEPSGATPSTPAVPRAGTKSAPRTKASDGLPFVIQKHAASHLHYDFRLGWSGVLKSWAVAKGPSYVVADKRLAVQVEDHPMEYGGFEGIIPQGQYGGGTVMVWDQGTWWPQPGHENVEAGLRTGSLKFEMHGSKMQGKWTLIRMHTTKPYPGDGGRWKSNDKPQWLLIKEHDEFERPASAPAIVDEAPNSALTGRTMDEIAHQSDHVWNSKETAGTGQAWFRKDDGKQNAPNTTPARKAHTSPSPKTKDRQEDAPPALRVATRPRPVTTPGPAPRSAQGLSAKASDLLDDLPREPQPEFLTPQLAQEVENPPDGPGWLHELKLDGYRMQARKSARGVQMLTRSGLDWTYRVPAVAEAVAQLPLGAVTLDGEVVVLAEDGTTNFADLQASFQNGEQNPLTFFCFDLLHFEGRNPRNLPLRDRKTLLAEILPKEEHALVRLSEHIDDHGQQMFEQACQLHAEGIVSKRADDPYQAGRRSSWLKSKCLHEQEFVVGGFTLSSDGPDRIGSLLIGYYAQADAGTGGAGQLIFAGRTGTGFTQKQRRELRAQLAPLEIKSPAFARVPADQRRDALWVRPELVAQVRFATWTAEDLVRQAAYLGLREDKQPQEVTREDAAKAPQPKTNERKQRSSSPNAPRPSTSVDVPHAKPAGNTSAASAKTLTPAPVRLTHPSKILDPESSLTKQQLADFYWAVADRMLPHIADRPLSLVRCPDGAGKPCFYQKHVNSMLPPGVGSVMVADKKGGAPEPYITLNTAEALAGLAQMGVLEIHPWSSRNNDLECPDRLILDLDPDESLGWQTVVGAAKEVKDRLKKLGLESFVKTTGGKGLHIVAPIVPEYDFTTIKDLAHRFVTLMERSNPKLYLTKMTKAARVGKIYLDYLRNERGATAVAPFSPRARSGVTVSVPLEWKELNASERPRFAVSEFPSWQQRLRRDPWKGMASLVQHLEPARLRTP